MIVGEAMAGKTKCLQVLVETMNQMHNSELAALQSQFVYEKAKKLGFNFREENGV